LSHIAVLTDLRIAVKPSIQHDGFGVGNDCCSVAISLPRQGGAVRCGDYNRSMDRSVHDKFLQMFPKSDYSIAWGEEQEAPEYPTGMASPDFFKCAFSIEHLENNHDTLAKKLEELKMEDTGVERLFTFYTSEPRLDFNPGDGIERLRGIIYYG
jgi:hypothetical protein